MFVFAQEDLAPSQQENLSSQSTNMASGEVMGADFFLGFELVELVTNFQIFFLAWTIFYTFVAIYQFLEYRIYFSMGEMGNEGMGMQGIYLAMQLWWSYLAVLLVFIGFTVFRASPYNVLLALLSIVAGLVKIYIDAPKILGLLGYFDWSKPVLKKLNKFFKPKNN